MADDFKYHIDHHGSLVRPPALVSARAAGDAGALTAAEDEAAVATAHEQRRLTLSAVSDGQFRRDHFESVVYDHVEGFGAADGASHPIADLCGIPAVRRRSVTGALAATGRLAEREVEPLLRTVDRPVFVALPSPGYLALLSDPSADPKAVAQTGEELASVLRTEIRALAGQGVAYVALGNPLLAPLLTVAGRERLAALSIDADALFDVLLAADRAAVAELSGLGDFRVGLDLTDHGPLPTTEGGYHLASLRRLVEQTPFHRLCVDFPGDPARQLPLEEIQPELTLSLGVVDVAVAAAESVDDLLALTDTVAERRDPDDVAFGTNAGFAASAAAPLMSAGEQHRKLQLVEMVCRYYWGNEI